MIAAIWRLIFSRKIFLYHQKGSVFVDVQTFLMPLKVSYRKFQGISHLIFRRSIGFCRSCWKLSISGRLIEGRRSQLAINLLNSRSWSTKHSDSVTLTIWGFVFTTGVKVFMSVWPDLGTAHLRSANQENRHFVHPHSLFPGGLWLLRQGMQIVGLSFQRQCRQYGISGLRTHLDKACLA